MLMTNAIHPKLQLRLTPTDGSAPGGPGDPAGFSSLLRQTQASAVPQPAPPPNAPPAPTPTPQSPHAAAPTPEPTAEAAHSHADNAEASEAHATNDTGEAHATNEPGDAATRSVATARARARDALARHARADAAPKADAATAQPTGKADETDPRAAKKTADTTVATAGANATAATDVPPPANAAAPAPIDPQIAQLLAAAQQRPGADKAGRPGSDAPQTNGASAPDATGKPPAAKDAPATRGATDADDLRAARTAPAGPTEPATSFAAALAEHKAAEPAAPAPDSSPATPVGALAGPSTPTASARALAEPTVVALPTPVDAPEFAQALGVQLSVFAKDGVQRAELHLNPADMGPVSVQIVMEGTQARIDFGADVAATRHAIESGLPELASALRDAGFTLAGGGVSQQSAQQSSQQPHGQRDGQPGAGGQARADLRSVGDDTLQRVTTAARRIVTAGGVDLYA